MTNPTLITTPFAENGDKNIIPESVGAKPQNATMQAGFPPITQQKISEGGIPPERDDFNGILNLYGQHIVHLNKGLPYEFDQAFANKIGGYPLGAELVLSDGLTKVVSSIPNNTTDPNTSTAGWINLGSDVGTVDSIADLSSLNPKDGDVVYVKGYYKPTNFSLVQPYKGGGVRIYIASRSDENDGFSCINGWVILVGSSFDLSQAGLVQGEDVSTILPEIFKFCSNNEITITGSGTYKLLNSTIVNAKYVNAKFSNLVLQPDFMVSGVRESFLINSQDGAYDKTGFVSISGLFLDCSLIPYSASTTEGNRRGIRGLTIKNLANVRVFDYKCKGSFYGSGLMIYLFNSLHIDGVDMQDVGAKFAPTIDYTLDYDSCGDAIYLGDPQPNISGDMVATTLIENVQAQASVMGRGGVVTEQIWTNYPDMQHTVTMNNCAFIGYQRTIHQEDKGTSHITWSGGYSSGFSNFVFNLGGTKNEAYLVVNNVTIVADTELRFFDRNGLYNFSDNGYVVFNFCSISYTVSSSQQGYMITNDCNIDVYKEVQVGGKVVTNINGGILNFKNGGVISSNANNNGLTVSMVTVYTDVLLADVFSFNNSTLVLEDCRLHNINIKAVNCTGGRATRVENCYYITNQDNVELFKNSTGSLIKINGGNFESMYSLANFATSDNCGFVINALYATNFTLKLNAKDKPTYSLSKITGNVFEYNVGISSVISSDQSLYAILSGNSFNQPIGSTITFPGETGSFKYKTLSNILMTFDGFLVL